MRRSDILLTLTGLFSLALATSSSLTPVQESSINNLIKRGGGGNGYSYCADSSDKLVFKNGQCACKNNKPNGWTLCEGPDTPSTGKAVCGDNGCNILCNGANMVVRWVHSMQSLALSLLSLSLSFLFLPFNPPHTRHVHDSASLIKRITKPLQADDTSYSFISRRGQFSVNEFPSSTV